jgi:prolipoprotein diacylglyceryl transferase
VTGLSFLPLSIPSPPDEWQAIDIASWLETTFGWDLPFNFRITTYALIILIGIIVAAIWVNRRLKARGAEPGIVLDVIIWAVPLGLVGARAYHVLTHLGDYFYEGSNPWNPFEPGSVWAIWEGGNAIIGSLIGGAIGAWIGCRLTGLRFWTFADALAPAMLLAQVFGRLGNYFNHELFGLPTDLPWGLEIPAPNAAIPVGLPDGTLFHPTFLYEMIWNTVGIVFLLTMERQFRFIKRTVFGLSVPVPVGDAVPRLQWGKVWALYMIWYGVGRVIFESIRVDPSEVFLGIRANVWGALALAVAGVILFLVQRRRHTGIEPSPYVPGREWIPEGAVDSEATYSDSDEPGDDAATESQLAATSGAKSTP